MSNFHETVYKITDSIISPDIVAFLNTEIINRPYIYLSYWSIIHLLSGVLFYKFISKNYKLWIMISMSFELIEYLLGTRVHPLYTEKFVDTIYDIILNLLGFKIAEKMNMKYIPIFKK